MRRGEPVFRFGDRFHVIAGLYLRTNEFCLRPVRELLEAAYAPQGISDPMTGGRTFSSAATECFG